MKSAQKYILYLGVFFFSACISLPKYPTNLREDNQTPFLGVELDSIELPKPPMSAPPLTSIILSLVFLNSPSWQAGFRSGDVITQINDKNVSEYMFRRPDDFRRFISSKNVGDELVFTVVRQSITGDLTQDGTKIKTLNGADEIAGADYFYGEQKSNLIIATWFNNKKTLQIKMKLQGRTYSFGEIKPIVSVDYDKLFLEVEDKYLIDASKRFNMLTADADIQNLLKKIESLSQNSDSQRPEVLTYLQRNPYQLQRASHWVKKELLNINSNSALDENIKILSQLGGNKINPNSLKIESAKNSIAALIMALQKSKQLVALATHDLALDDLNTLKENLPALALRFTSEKYIQSDLPISHLQNLFDQLKSITRIHPKEFITAAQALSQKLNYAALLQIRKNASELYENNNKKTVTLDTELGKILIFGPENNRHVADINEKVALMIDLGGDDWYGDNNYPIIDFAGDDVYEAAQNWTIGGSVFDVNFVVDWSGNDSYRARNGNFGSTLFGVSLFWDREGNDDYRCMNYCNGAAFGGVGLMVDGEGSDHYSSLQLSQGVAIAGGFALLSDLGGNDFYYSKGSLQTGYGDMGQYEGWSQGVSVGLRGFVSGGIAILYDRKGADKFEAGNFSQGGGYYYGWGLLINDGDENDRYDTSRYGQGFSAHYAIGTFIDVGGNEIHLSRDSVAQGMSWDLGLTLFEDYSGNDQYLTCEHCLGMASQSALTIFIDHAGNDNYMGSLLPLDSEVENDYHKGISLGLFLDRGHGEDFYGKMKNNSSQTRNAFQLLIDE